MEISKYIGYGYKVKQVVGMFYTYTDDSAQRWMIYTAYTVRVLYAFR
jgi:hypothetical protein